MMDNDAENNEEETYDEDIEEEVMGPEEKKKYNEKLSEMRTYLPLLQSLMAKCAKDDNQFSAGKCMKKLRSLYNTFANPGKKLKFSTVLRCEKILKSLEKKMKKTTVCPKKSNDWEGDSWDSSPGTSSNINRASSPGKVYSSSTTTTTELNTESLLNLPPPPARRKPSPIVFDETLNTRNPEPSLFAYKANPRQHQPNLRQHQPLNFNPNTRFLSPREYSNARFEKPSFQEPTCEEEIKVHYSLNSQERFPFINCARNVRQTWNNPQPSPVADLREKIEKKKMDDFKVTLGFSTSRATFETVGSSQGKNVEDLRNIISSTSSTRNISIDGPVPSHIRLSDFENSRNIIKDQDTLFLENSQRKLEALMKNRLATMNANKITSTFPSNREKESKITSCDTNTFLNTKDNKVKPLQVVGETTSPFSSTLDEMMSNVISKYRTNRCLTQNKQPPSESHSDSAKNALKLAKINGLIKEDNVDDPELHLRVKKFIQDSSKKRLSSPSVSQAISNQKPQYMKVPFSTEPSTEEKLSTNTERNQCAMKKPETVLTVPDSIKPNVVKNRLNTDVLKSNTPGSKQFENINYSDTTFKIDDSAEKEQDIKSFHKNSKELNFKTKESKSLEKKTSHNFPGEFSNLLNNVKFNSGMAPGTKDISRVHPVTDELCIIPGLDGNIPPLERPEIETEKTIEASKSKFNQAETPKTEESEVNKPNQSLRSKLNEEISTIHKIGSSYGGALRGLINRDKLPPGRIASLKPGALIDLINEEKPHRPVAKSRNRPHQQNLITDVSEHSSCAETVKSIPDPVCTSKSVKNPDDILSQLSENDLKKLITENIESLPIPPNIPFFNNTISKNSPKEVNSQVSTNALSVPWNNPQNNVIQQVNLHANNVIINNINITPKEYNNTYNNALTHYQTIMPSTSWHSNQKNEVWRSGDVLKDPRRDPQNIGQTTNYGSLNNTDMKRNFDNKPDVLPKACENPSYSKSTDSYKSNKFEMGGELFNTSYNPPVLQSNPYYSPCYDGSNTPDPYRPDPYTLSLQERKEPSFEIPMTPDTKERPSLLGVPPVTYDRESPLRPSLLGPGLLAQHNMDMYNNYSDSQQLRPNDIRRNVPDTPSTYGAWKAEKHLVESRKLVQSQHYEGNQQSYYHRMPDSQRRYGNYHWSRDKQNLNLDQQNRNYNDNICPPNKLESGNHNRNYKDSVCPPTKVQSDNFLKLSARDPRRKSVDSSGVDQKSVDQKSMEPANVNNRDWLSRPDSRTRDRTPPKERGRSWERSRSKERRRSRERGYHNVRSGTAEKNLDKSPYRRTKDVLTKNSRNDKSSTEYTSPLDSLYNNTTTPKTGLGYGFQKFRIPKLNKSNERSSKNHIHDSKTVSEKDRPTKESIQLDNKETSRSNEMLSLESKKEAVPNTTNNDKEVDKNAERFLEAKSDLDEDESDSSYIDTQKNRQRSKSEIQSNQESNLETNMETVAKEYMNSPFRRSSRLKNIKKNKHLPVNETAELHQQTIYKEAEKFDEENINKQIKRNVANCDTNSSEVSEERSEKEIDPCNVDKSNEKATDKSKNVAKEVEDEALHEISLTEQTLKSNIYSKENAQNQILITDDTTNFDKTDGLIKSSLLINSAPQSNSSDVLDSEPQREEKDNKLKSLVNEIEMNQITEFESDREAPDMNKDLSISLSSNQTSDCHQKDISQFVTEQISASDGTRKEIQELSLRNYEQNKSFPINQELQSNRVNEEYCSGNIQKSVKSVIDHKNFELLQEKGAEKTVFENECAIDLSVKKNTDDEAIPIDNHLKKTVSNPAKIPCNPLLFESNVIDHVAIPKDASQIVPENKVSHSVSNDQGQNIRKQITPELFQDVLGYKLSPDKLKKVAEILSDFDSTEKVNETGNIPEENQCVMISSTDQHSLSSPENKTSPEPTDLDVKQVDEVEIDKCTTISIPNKTFKVEYDSDDKKPVIGRGRLNKTKRKIKQKPKPSPPKVNNEEKDQVSQKRKRKYKNELDRLQDDISKYHDSEAIAAASGPRLCRLQKEKSQLITLPAQNTNQVQSYSKKKTIAKKVKEIKQEIKLEESSNSDSDSSINANVEKGQCISNEEDIKSESDSSDCDAFLRLSEKLKSKYEPMILENEARLKREQEEKGKEQRRLFSSQERVSTDINKTTQDTPNLDKNIVDKDKKQNNECINKTDSQKSAIGETVKSKKSNQGSEVSKSKKPEPVSQNKTANESDNLNNSLVSSTNKSRSTTIPQEKSKSVTKLNPSEDSEDESPPQKSLSNNILHKYGIKKQKKKCFWKAGIIKKKPKSKKSLDIGIQPSEAVEADKIEEHKMKEDKINEDTEDDSCETDDSFSDVIGLEPPDLNYYQEGESKATKCKLCSFTGKTIVSHYAITHPKDEVIISRMSPKAADEAIKESRVFFKLDIEKQKEFSVFRCRICYLEFMKFTNFFEHMALHTGEFRHECCKCGYRTSTRSGIVKHFLSHNIKSTSKTSCRVVYKEPVDQSFFCGYLCSLCNFFQISQINVKRHIENNHDSQDFSNIIKINFSKLLLKDSDFITSNEGVDAAVNESSHQEKNSSDTENQLQVSMKVSSEIKNENSTANNYLLKNSHESSVCLAGNTAQISALQKDTDLLSGKILDSSNVLNNSDLIHQKNKPDIINNIIDEPDKVGITLRSTLSDVENQESTAKIPENVVKDPAKLQEPGCFEQTSGVDEKTHTLNKEIVISYKQKCAEVIAALTNRRDKNLNINFIEKLASKLNVMRSESSSELILESLVEYKRKERRKKDAATTEQPLDACDQEVTSQADKNDQLAQNRRQLPDRVCKGAPRPRLSDSDSDFGTDEDSILIQFLQYIESQDSDDELTLTDRNTDLQESATYDVSLLLYENQIERCKKLIVNERTYEPTVKEYISSLPLHSNLSEFRHVMKQITQVILKPPETMEISVGGLKVFCKDNEVIFKCSMIVFNKQCEFQTSSLEAFGQHVNLSHHQSYWDGTCGTCFVVFIQDPSSHDKTTIYTQSRAFCHLVREHLTFTKRPLFVARNSGNLEEGSMEKTSVPFLRVRRLSGDMLSIPSPDTENSHPEPLREVGYCEKLNKNKEATEKSVISSSSSDHPSISSGSIANTRPSNVGFINLTKWMDSKEPSVKVFPVFYQTVLSKPTYKTIAAYKAMCSTIKLRHFYKCMGANCIFTTTMAKEFNIHLEEHRQTYQLCPEDDPDQGYWRYCAYCSTMHTTSRELCVHLRKEHGYCNLQCGYCFYRARSIANLHFHHNLEHANVNFKPLQCEQWEKNLPPIIEKPFTQFVTALRCIRGGCNLFTYMLDTFYQHVNSLHPNDMLCHICAETHNTVWSLFEHYKRHGIGLYQCLYCTYGTSTEKEMRIHLCYRHPCTEPKAIHRTDSSGKKTFGGQNKESLRRLVFYKDQDKLLSFIIPMGKDSDAKPHFTEIEPELSSANITQALPANTPRLLAIPSQPFRPNILRSRPLILKTPIIRPVKGKSSEPSPKRTGDLTNSPRKYLVVNRDGTTSKGGFIYPVTLTSTQSGISVISTVQNLLTLSPGTKMSSIRASTKMTTISSPISNTSLECVRKPVIVSASGPVVPTSSTVVTTSPAKMIFTSSVSPVTSTTVISMSPAKMASPASTSKSAIEISDSSESPEYSVSSLSIPVIEISDSENSMSSLVDSDSNSSTTSSNTVSLENIEENYFKCGNKGCNFESSTSGPLKNHLVICDHARQSQRLVCVYCKRLFKQALSLIDHLRSHGPKRFSCSLCEFKAPLQSRVNSHMKSSHHITTTVVLPVHSRQQDPDKDYFVVSPKEKRTRVNEKPGTKGGKGNEVKTKFTPNELDEIPKMAIFQTPLGCALCSYETKVRSNLHRHVFQHKTGDSVSQEEVVNPVPEKTEKMFDKMMNLAGSSHKKKTIQHEEVDVECQYKYVPDQLRYKCHLKECGYQTITESMLRDHISVIHKDETLYVCPHCSEDEPPVLTDQLGLHLKLHDCPLFKCSYCKFYSHVRRTIERHQSLFHSEDRVSVLIVRMSKPDETSEPLNKPLVIGQPEEQGEEWYSCTLCSFKTKKKKQMLSHGITEHKVAKPFKCSVCGYESMFDTIFSTHFKTYHPKEACHIIALYKKVTTVKKPPLASIPPLWKRDAKRIKLIRGIKLDEKGDAQAPVATSVYQDITNLDLLELKFGSFGKPDALGAFICPRCSWFSCRNKQDMREHLYKDLEYKPFVCSICKVSGTQKHKLMKHVSKSHSIEWEKADNLIESHPNEDLEAWVEKLLSRQQSLMKEVAAPTNLTVPPLIITRKRRRSSTEGTFDGKTNEDMPSFSKAESFTKPQSDHITDNDETASSSGSDNSPGKGDGCSPEKKRRDKCPSRHRFQCGHCDLSTKYKNSIMMHSKKVHPNLSPNIITLIKSPLDDKTNAYNCMYCNCTAVNLSNLKHHWTMNHKVSGLNFMFRNTFICSELEYECFWCKRRSNLETLEEHCEVDHPELRFLVVSVTVPKYKCSECKLVFNSVDILKRHFSMDHPSKTFCYIVVNAQKPVSASDKNPLSQSLHSEASKQPKRNTTYKCFSCHFVSSLFWPMVKHMQRHFVTYCCTECDQLFSTSLAYRSHMVSKHPGSETKPLILKGSDKDIENAKRDILVVSKSGVKRKITEEELSQAEKEETPCEQSIEMYSYDEPVKFKGIQTNIRETARKSTSPKRKWVPNQQSTSPKRLDSSPPRNLRSPDKYKKALCKVKRKKTSLDNVFVTITSRDKNIRLPVKTLQKLVNFDMQLSLNSNIEECI